LRSKRSRTYGFHQTSPRGHDGVADVVAPVLRRDALATSVSGSLRQGPGSGLALHARTSDLLVMPVARGRSGFASAPSRLNHPFGNKHQW
jgi:hypothetical protein